MESAETAVSAIHAATAILRETMPHYEQPLVDAMGAVGQIPFCLLNHVTSCNINH